MANALIYRLLTAFITFLGFIPPAAARFCADVLAVLWFNLDIRHQKVVLTNLENVYKDELSRVERYMLAKKIYKNFTYTIFEAARVMRLPRKKVKGLIEFRGIENHTKARAKGKGILVLTCHLGNWELILAGAAMVSQEIATVYRKLDFPPLERFVQETRKRFGALLIPTRGAAKQVKQVLQRGGLVGLLMDQNVDWYQGAFVNFMGRLTCASNGMAKLALDTGAPVISAFMVKEDGRNILEIGPEIPLFRSGDRTRDLEENTQNYNAVMESIIRRYPDQWFWMHNRWKTQTSCPWPKQGQ